jgi:hypothetical protein
VNGGGEAAARQVIAGVSMRDYEDAINGVVDGYGIRRSAVTQMPQVRPNKCQRWDSNPHTR